MSSVWNVIWREIKLMSCKMCKQFFTIFSWTRWPIDLKLLQVCQFMCMVDYIKCCLEIVESLIWIRLWLVHSIHESHLFSLTFLKATCIIYWWNKGMGDPLGYLICFSAGCISLFLVSFLLAKSQERDVDFVKISGTNTSWRYCVVTRTRKVLFVTSTF